MCAITALSATVTHPMPATLLCCLVCLSSPNLLPPAAHLLCVNLAQPTAAVRLRMKGGHGGHNGLRSVMQHFGGSQDFPRLKIGARVSCLLQTAI